MHGLSTAQIAEYLCVTKRTIHRRANKENWRFEYKTSLGGQGKVYDFGSLPEAVKRILIAKIIAKHEKQAADYQANSQQKPHTAKELNLTDTPFIKPDRAISGNWVSSHSFAYNIDETELNKEHIKLGLLVMANLYVVSFSLGKIKGIDEFCRLYNEQQISLNKAVYSVVGHVSRITLLRLEKLIKSKGQSPIHSTVKNRRKISFEPDLMEMALEILMYSPQITAVNLRQHLLTLYKNRQIPSIRHLGLWLKQELQEK